MLQGGRTFFVQISLTKIINFNPYKFLSRLSLSLSADQHIHKLFSRDLNTNENAFLAHMSVTRRLINEEKLERRRMYSRSLNLSHLAAFYFVHVVDDTGD